LVKTTEYVVAAAQVVVEQAEVINTLETCVESVPKAVVVHVLLALRTVHVIVSELL